MLYCQYTNDQAISFVHEQKALCQQFLSQCRQGRYEEAVENCRKSCVRYEYSSRSGNILHRGIYHEGDAMEIAVSNVGRGKPLKKPPAAGKAYNRYLFDNENNLLCTEWYTEGICVSHLYEREYIIDADGMQFGLSCDSSFYYNRLYAAKYDDEKLLYTYTYDGRISDICFYDYDENGRKYAASIMFDDAEMIFNTLKVYYYCYNDDGNIIGFRDSSGYFIAAKNACSKKYMTAAKLAEQMKTILEQWDITDNDIYTLSAFYEINSAEELVSFYIGYNTETAFRQSLAYTDDESEARWNYAYWLQNDKPLFSDNTVRVKHADCGGAEQLLVNSVKRLRKSGIIPDIFGREIPVIIHGLEYYPDLAEYNISANTKKILPKDFIDFCGRF
ncbi:MAG: hypothetical protein IJ368_00690 [Oscillospiraceae bacterium]|nr:hypothetical protein [Oscillospiraceae bacterium]